MCCCVGDILWLVATKNEARDCIFRGNRELNGLLRADMRNFLPIISRLTPAPKISHHGKHCANFKI